MKMAIFRIPPLISFLIFFLTGISQAQSQDSLRISLEQAEKIFLSKNLLLLAEQYNLSAAQAMTIQARAYPNPQFSAEINLIDPENKRVLHTGSTGQKVFGIDQLIVMGGKRKTQIEIARKNQVLAELELADLLRNLKWKLHHSYFSLAQQQFIIQNYNRQLILLDTIISNYEKQAARGNIAMKEVIRLKSVYLAINNSRSEQIQNQIESNQVLQNLLQEKNPLTPQIPDADFQRYTQIKMLDQLIQSAKANRPDLQKATQTGELANLNLSLQKQLAIPDLNLNAGYDQRGGAFNNQINIGLGIPLPIWNRNKGAIKAAEWEKKASETLLQQKQTEVESEILASQRNLERCISDFTKTNSMYSTDFDLVFKGINDNFQKRNVSLIEFIDFFESYNQSLIEFQRVRTQMALAAAYINYVTATPIY